MYIGLGILAVIVIYLIAFFNGLKTVEVQIKASIQEIGNQLKRQADLIPNLVESVKGYMKHEKDIISELAAARKMVDKAISTNDPKAIDKAEEMISNTLRSITFIAESNPQIQASTVVADLMNELRDTSDKVMYARRTLIDLTADFNITISRIPGLWLAPIMGFTPKQGLDTPVSGEFLSVSSDDTKTPKVKIES